MADKAQGTHLIPVRCNNQCHRRCDGAGAVSVGAVGRPFIRHETPT